MVRIRRPVFPLPRATPRSVLLIYGPAGRRILSGSVDVVAVVPSVIQLEPVIVDFMPPTQVHPYDRRISHTTS